MFIPRRLAEEVVQGLCGGPSIVLAYGGVGLAVGPELDRSAVVQAIVLEVIEPEQHYLAAGDDAVAAGVGRDANYAVVQRDVYYSIAVSVLRLGRVEKVNEAIGGELGVEGDPRRPKELA